LAQRVASNRREFEFLWTLVEPFLKRPLEDEDDTREGADELDRASADTMLATLESVRTECSDETQPASEAPTAAEPQDNSEEQAELVAPIPRTPASFAVPTSAIRTASERTESRRVIAAGQNHSPPVPV
jgi:hypothetical protein